MKETIKKGYFRICVIQPVKSTMNKYLECGKITNTHGIKGAVKAVSYCDTPEDLASLPAVYTERLGVYTKHEILDASIYKDIVILTLDGIDDIDKAAKLKNRTIYALRDDFKLDDGSYFLADLIGLDVIDAGSGKIYGKIENVITNSAQLLYEIKTEAGIKLLPGVSAFIKEIVPEKAMFVTPVPGLLDDQSDINTKT